ncbi:MAG: hypothetical protein K2F63_01960, partial [Muribaculaceae bacterium]|nr:hypothetical protein [Muribaculaceae bacterium]
MIKYDIVGSFLPPADMDTASVDSAVADLVEQEIEAGLTAVTSGEFRRKTWDLDFYVGLGGISFERVDAGRIYQPYETFTDILRLSRPVVYNPEHPFFSDFEYLREATAGRAACRQTLPSPADLYLQFLSLDVPVGDDLAQEIALAYRLTIERFYDLGCRSVLLDDTAFGRLADPEMQKELVQGGVNVIELQNILVSIVNDSLAGLPADLEKCIYLSAGTVVVPEWRQSREPDNILPRVFGGLDVDVFYLPFEPDRRADLEVLRMVPEGKRVVLGLLDAHTPFPDDVEDIRKCVEIAGGIIPEHLLSVSHRSGFKVGSHALR